MKFFIAGVQHHDFAKVIKDLEEGEELELVPEPTNKYDPNAVRIIYEGVMLGYVPKKFSSEVSAMLETGTEVICIINSLNKTAKPWEMIEVSISEIEEEDLEDFVEEEEE